MIRRGSDKHGPLLDETLESEVASYEKGAPASSRVEEFRDPEAPDDDEPEPDVKFTTDQTERRSELAKHLDRHVFPAGKDALVEDAIERHAPTWIVEALSRLPGDRAFENVAQIWEALGGTNERRD